VSNWSCRAGVGARDYCAVSHRSKRAGHGEDCRWAGSGSEVFGGDDVVAAAMIDRLVHHAEVVATNGTQTVLG
jgi:hypothetical protein